MNGSYRLCVAAVAVWALTTGLGCGPPQATTTVAVTPSVETVENEDLRQHLFLGQQFLKSKIYDRAAEEFIQGLEIDPENGELYGLLGYSYLEDKQYELATKTYQRYADLRPTECEAQANLGYAYLRRKMSDQALVHYEKALALCPDDPNAFNNMGKAYLEAGDEIEAIEVFRRAVELNPQDILAYESLASVYWRRKLYPEAIATYQAILAQPDHGKEVQWVAWANDRLGYMYRWGGASDQAVACYHRVLEARPNDAKMMLRATQGLAVAYDRGKQTDKAIIWYQKLVDASPEKSNYYYRLGELMVDVGRHKEAVTLIKKGQNYDTGCGARALCALGTAYEKQKLYQKAKRVFRQASNCNDANYSEYAAKEVGRQEQLIKIEALKVEKDKQGY